MESLHLFAQNHLFKVAVSHHNYSTGKILKEVDLKFPQVLIIDDLSLSSGFEEELNLLKHFDHFKSILIVCLCYDKEEVISHRFLLTLGVQILYLKGNDLDDFFRDVFLMGFEDRFGASKFARAENLAIPITIGLCSSISAINQDGVIIETDVKLPTDEGLNLVATFLEEAPTLNYVVKDHSSSPFHFQSFETYELSHPYPGPWDEVTAESISPEQIETWIGLNQPSFDGRSDTIAIFSRNFKLTWSYIINDKTFKWAMNEVVSLDVVTFLKLRRPVMIFMDMSEIINFESLVCVIEGIQKVSDYTPIVIVLNYSTGTEAMRKAHNYPHLLVTQNKLDENLLALFVQKYTMKVKSSDERPYHFFRVNDPIRVSSVPVQILITGMTEHEVTFICPHDLPVFSVLEFNLPMSFYLTLTPPYLELHISEKGTHYMGIIHGLTEIELAKLRKIVNQLIYRPTNELSTAIVEKMLKQNYFEVVPKILKPHESPLASNITVLHKSIPETDANSGYKIVRKKCYNGRSKL